MVQKLLILELLMYNLVVNQWDTKNFCIYFHIGRTDSASNGKFSSWDTNKTIENWVREYNSTGNSWLHKL